MVMKHVKKVGVVLLFMVAVLTGCDNFGLLDLLDSGGDSAGGNGEPLSIVPVSVTVEVGSEFTFTATGGVPPYLFSFVSGLGSIDPESGVYTAPMDASVDVVQVEDNEGSLSSARIVVVF